MLATAITVKHRVDRRGNGDNVSIQRVVYSRMQMLQKLTHVRLEMKLVH